MESVLILGIALFAATNVDTFLVLVAFFLDEDYRHPEVLIGHGIGVFLGIGAAVIGARLATEILVGWTFSLGFVPLALGLWGLFRRDDETTERPAVLPSDSIGRTGVVTMAAIGLNGENLAVFIPFFARLGGEELLIIVFVYLLLAGALYVIALVLAHKTFTYGHPRWIDRWLVPLVLVLVGTWVVVTGWVAIY